jgi:hypothetical protein
MIELSYNLACSSKWLNRAKYIMALIASASGIRLYPKAENADIVYGGEQTPDSIYIPWQPMAALEGWRIHEIDEIAFYLPGNVNGQLFDIQGRRYAFDLIDAMSLYLVDALDAHKNPKTKGIRIPVTPKAEFNEFIRLFVQTLKVCRKIPSDFSPKTPWPNNGTFALGLSHDIDILKRKIPGSLKALFGALYKNGRRQNPASAWQGLLDSTASRFFGQRNPYCNFEAFYSGGHRSTTFIFSGNRNDGRDPTYNLDSVFRELALFLDKTELALHNGIGTWNMPNRLKKDKADIERRLGKDIKGIRPHYLDCRLPDFWRNLDGFDYASSLGCDSIPGFVGGINIPLYGFTLPDWNRLDIIELPIGLMDCALFTIADKERRYQFIDEIIASCEINHGLLIIDWHNTSSYDNDYPGWYEAYQYLLAKAGRQKAYIGSLAEISGFWRNRCESVFSF